MSEYGGGGRSFGNDGVTGSIFSMNANQYATYQRRFRNKGIYKSIIDDADSPRILYSDDIKVYTGNGGSARGMDKIYAQRFDYLWNNPKADKNDVGIDFFKASHNDGWWDMRMLRDHDKLTKYALKKVREGEPSPELWDDSKLDSLAINVDAVKGLCTRYHEDVYLKLKKIQEELSENLPSQIGNEKLNVDGKGYNIVMEDLAKCIESYTKLIHSTEVALEMRVEFLHDFQVKVQKDYIRYFGDTAHYNCRKNWNRSKDGWEIWQ